MATRTATWIACGAIILCGAVVPLPAMTTEAPASSDITHHPAPNLSTCNLSLLLELNVSDAFATCP